MKIYPIPCQLKSGAEIKAVKILSVSHNGLVVDSLETPLLVNKTYVVQFVFPIIDENTEIEAVVFKTYAELRERKSRGGRVHMNELVFKKPSLKFKRLLVKFLARVANIQKV